MKLRYIYTTLVGCVLTLGAYGQSVADIQGLLRSGQYDEAKAVLQPLIKKAPANAQYQYMYGVACYETGDLKTAVVHLQKSNPKRLNEAYPYLGKALNALYAFDKAENVWSEYLTVLQRKKANTDEAQAGLAQSKRGSRMLRAVEKVTVVDSMVVDKKDFFQHYRLSSGAGTLTATAAQDGISFTNALGDKRLFSKADAQSVRKLYASFKLLGGWERAEPIASLNEREGNLDYPFLANDGITFYFSADGEESLGGYDLFVTRYDAEENSYLRPQAMNFPFNSPANDYLLVIDEESRLGWFASDRFQPSDKVCIYIFIPEENREMYDYDKLGEAGLYPLATLRSIRATQRDAAAVQEAKARIAQLHAPTTTKTVRADFDFVISDAKVYHRLTDFRTTEGKRIMQTYLEKQKREQNIETQLTALRQRFVQGERSVSANILSLEQEVKKLREELTQLRWQIVKAEQ